MTGRSCGVCDGIAAAGARFCSECGAPLDATVVSLARDSKTGTDTDALGRSDRDDRRAVAADAGARGNVSRRPSRLLAAVAVLLLAVGAVAMIAASGGDDGAAPLPRPTPDRTLRNDAPRPVPSATPAGRPPATPGPTATVISRPESVAPGDLPLMEATHLAVVGRDTVQFLDLRTGIWARPSGWTSPPFDVRSARGGLVARTTDGSWVFASVDGGEVTVLADGAGGMAVAGATLLVTVAFDGVQGELEARRFDGTVAWTVPLPTGALPVGVTDDGRLILQLAERIVILDGVTGTARPVATGSAVATLDDTVVLWSCDERLRCATSQLDVTTGAATVISDRHLWFEPAGSGRFVGYPQQGGELQVFAVVDGVLTEVEDTVATNPAMSAADASGVTVALGRDTIRFTTPEGDVTTIVAPPAAGPYAGLRLVSGE